MKNFLLSVSLDCPASLNIEFSTKLQKSPDMKGHGFAWYPEDGNATLISKDALSFSESGKPKTLVDWKRFRSSTFFINLHGASETGTLETTQPFSKPVGGKDWLFMMQGRADINEVRKILSKQNPFYEPIGSSVAEAVFCLILNRVQNRTNKKLHEIGWKTLHKWFSEINSFGACNFYISDGLTIAIYKGNNTENIYHLRRVPPFETTKIFDEKKRIELDFCNSVDILRTQYIFSTSPLSSENWKEMQSNQLIAVKRGAVIYNSESKKVIAKTLPEDGLLRNIANNNSEIKVTHNNQHTSLVFTPQEMQLSAEILKDFEAKKSDSEYNFYINTLNHEDARLIKVTHKTVYKYTEAIERSEHIFKLMPQYSRYQQLLKFSLDVSVEVEQMIYRDTFDNDVVHMIIEKPYSELSIESKSLVRIHKIDPDDLSFTLRKTQIPYAWMPWQRQMMQAYLLPPELPETQLRELTDYAMSFVDRNDNKLFETLIDINRSIYKDYKYKQGVTDFNTTAFDVYAERHGVCQDFANLLICLARLLSVPARYRMGYIYTGADYENKIQSEATHAWVELYIPYIGWRGFDPTNGKMVDQDYVRVACGRNYIDATPTSGTIYKGGGDETLEVEVKTEVVG
jgi:transglutaminase-like putative cysteine protease/predicted glutamine amidotransferase